LAVTKAFLEAFKSTITCTYYQQQGPQRYGTRCFSVLQSVAST